jgi:hypothetical protein
MSAPAQGMLSDEEDDDDDDHDDDHENTRKKETARKSNISSSSQNANTSSLVHSHSSHIAKSNFLLSSSTDSFIRIWEVDHENPAKWSLLGKISAKNAAHSDGIHWSILKLMLYIVDTIMIHY